MVTLDRRLVLGGLALGWAGRAAAQGAPAADGHAAGYDAAAAPRFVPLIPRRPGAAEAFSAALDSAPAKATSGGWAREVTARQLPLAAQLAGAHLFMNPGGAREMHWHNSAEWACVLGGRCQVTVLDPQGEMEVVNLGPGDLWYFPAGHAHAIQTLGDAPCHAILVFNDGLYSEHGTFGISDILSRFDPEAVARHLGLPPDMLAGMPEGETYIAQGTVLAADGPEARATALLGPAVTHRYRLAQNEPYAQGPGGTLRIASAAEFPVSADMTGVVTELKPDAMHVLHWHPHANEWLYVARGGVHLSLYLPDKHLGTAALACGDCAYVPANCVHSLHNTGSGDCQVISVLDKGNYAESSIAEWVAKAPGHLLANNLNLSVDALAARVAGKRAVVAG